MKKKSIVQTYVMTKFLNIFFDLIHYDYVTNNTDPITFYVDQVTVQFLPGILDANLCKNEQTNNKLTNINDRSLSVLWLF